MSTVDRYVEQVLARVFAAPEERNRFESDLRAHFAEAEAGGRSPAQIIDSMGSAADVATAFNAERPFQYAGFWKRLVAFIGDLGTLGLLLAPFAGIAVYTSMRQGPNGEPSFGAMVALATVAIAVVGVVVFYFPLLESRFGKTLGKHLMKIRVVRETGAPVSLGQAFVRRLSLFFEMLWVDALFIPFTDKKQRALDIIAKTVVADEPGEPVGVRGYLLCFVLPLVFGLALTALLILSGT